MRGQLIALLIAAVALAGCGVDGEPVPPAPKSGVTVSGTVEMGVTGSL